MVFILGKRMDFELVKNFWPNAHSNWKVILRKKNGKTNIKEKEKDKTNVFPIYKTIQTTKEAHQLH